MDTLDITLLGDDRERTYRVTYLGSADFPRWERPSGGVVGLCRAALVDDNGHEVLVAEHPDYGWCSVNDAGCRDFDPPLDEDRLNRAR